MTTRKHGAVLRQLNTLFNIGSVRELTDGQLLKRFLTGRGEVAEMAFEALIARHGAMVLRVCRATLADPHDAEDAFQATFLILLKKARTLWIRDSLGPWLHEVAFRTASCARSAAFRRRRHERQVAEIAAKVEGPEGRTRSELAQALHEEINRLPERYRTAVVLCELEGFTCEEVARQMGRPVGTVKSWCFRGRERLHHRLTRLGLAPAAGLTAALAVDNSRAAMPEEIVKAAVRALFDWTTAGEVSASVHTLVEGVLKTMIFGKLRMTATAVFALAFLTAGLGAVAWVVAQDLNRATDRGPGAPGRPAFVEQPSRDSPSINEHGEAWSLSLREAIRIGLDNSSAIRLISLWGHGTPCKIAPRKAVDAEQFKAEVMATVRSIEQKYWNLRQARVQLLATDQAVKLAEGVKKHEEGLYVISRNDAAGIAEASQRLERFNLDLATKTADVITTERQLRKALGVPIAGDRRIVPVTAPTEARLDLNWEECRADMLEKQPDIAHAKALVRKAESNVGDAGLAELERRQFVLRQIIDRKIQSITRVFREIDENYKQFETARNLRFVATERLKTQQRHYDNGRIAVDRYLDAVSQYAAAVAAEARGKTLYNNAIVALNEAVGTLLVDNQIAIVDGPAGSAVAARDGAVKPAWGEPSALIRNADATGPPAATPMDPLAADVRQSTSRSDTANPRAKDMPPKADGGGKTYSFHVAVGFGSNPLEVRGSFTITPVQPAGISN